MKQRLVGLALLGMAGLNASCALYDDRCGERSRDVSVTGRVPNPDDPSAGYFQFTLVERETTEPKQSGYWLLIDESLRNHVQAARLRGVDGQLLLELTPVQTPAGTQETYQGQIPPYNGAVSFAGLYALAESNQVAIIVRTDIAGRDSLRALLQVVGSNPWSQPHCS